MDDELRQAILDREWFYRFELPTGEVTRSYLPEQVAPIHETRARMMRAFLEDFLGDEWGSVRCLDLACHEGYFAIELARRGAAEVLGIDARAEHVESARLISRAWNLSGLHFRRGDIQRLEAEELGRHDVVLLFGVLYHLQDVVGVLRAARALTRRVCLIETQVAPDLAGDVEWGSVDFRKPIEGCFAIVSESAELRDDNKEAGIADISLVPSLGGLLYLLEAVGFSRAAVLEPPPDGYEQLVRGQRVMVAASPGTCG